MTGLSPGLAAHLDRLCDYAPTDDLLDEALDLAQDLAVALADADMPELWWDADRLREIVGELISQRVKRAGS